jgi:hypothetical protein
VGAGRRVAKVVRIVTTWLGHYQSALGRHGSTKLASHGGVIELSGTVSTAVVVSEFGERGGMILRRDRAHRDESGLKCQHRTLGGREVSAACKRQTHGEASGSTRQGTICETVC